MAPAKACCWHDRMLALMRDGPARGSGPGGPLFQIAVTVSDLSLRSRPAASELRSAPESTGRIIKCDASDGTDRLIPCIGLEQALRCYVG